MKRFVKYNSKKTVFEGKVYDSKFEAEVAKELNLRKKGGEFTLIEPQFRIPLYIYTASGEQKRLFAYVCDFRCTKPDGSFQLVEAKGYLTQIYKIKKKVLELVWLPDHPDYTFEEITKNVSQRSTLSKLAGRR